MTEDQPRATSRRRVLHVAALLALCAVAFFPGLDRHGVTNWQEAQRLIVAREMQDRFRAARQSDQPAEAWRELLVPRINSRPYLAKPPMIYWAQIGLAGSAGQRVELWHLRAIVAIAATLGVLATYLAAITVLRPDGGTPATPTPQGPMGVPIDRAWIDRAAFWSAAMLATGVLYVRSGRIGELDILLAPLCVLAIGALARAWRVHRVSRRTDFAAILLAAIATTLATLTKDPAVMIVGLAAYGGIGLWAAFATSGTRVDVSLFRGRGTAPLQVLPEPVGVRRRIPVVLACVLAVAAMFAAAANADSAIALPGVLILSALAAFVGLTLGRLSWPLRFRAMFVALSRTHPLAVVGSAVLIRLAWGGIVSSIIGPEAAGALVRQEVEDNVRLFLPEAPQNNLEAIAFGVGLGSIAAAFTAIMLVRDRFRPPPSLVGWFQLAAWLIFTFAAFSILGKGVQRYLTPMWPAVAMLGGIGIAAALGLAAGRLRVLRPALITAVVMLATAQGWWYGYGRERSADRSPRDLISELRARNDVLLYRVFSFEFTTPALDYYLDRHVRVVGDPRVNESMAGGASWSVDRLIESIRRSGRPAFGLLRSDRIPGEPDDAPTAVERLRAAGLVVHEIQTSAVFRIDKGRSEVRCYKVRLPLPGDSDDRGEESPEEPADSSEL
ncbi:MAG: hypothetical protein KF768_05575 [Phycisphaeraceae bacterium]|nr:hypothetical protein [Phycisphaeraceae bacterium]